jgi:ribonuclease HII
MLTAGVDEAGRGPLAGPVIAAAVILDPARPLAGLADSKTLSAARRERLFEDIVGTAVAYAIGEASVAEIDALNIFQATLLAMQRAVATLRVTPAHVLVDGNACPRLSIPVSAVVRGDATVPSISAASILAKVTRDRLMDALDTDYPQYGFGRHRGYPTAVHLRALAAHGACPAHRRSFRPVAVSETRRG